MRPNVIDNLFTAASSLAMFGWVCLLMAHRRSWANFWLSGCLIPAILTSAYAIVLALSWRPGRGGFGSLDAVQVLFSDRGILLAGWIHYLAFDLLIGAWQARRATSSGQSRVLLFPCLLLTFLVGPVGWFLYVMLSIGTSGDPLRVLQETKVQDVDRA